MSWANSPTESIRDIPRLSALPRGESPALDPRPRGAATLGRDEREIHMLPEPISAYLDAAAGGDPATIAAVFAEDATVTDEGRTYTGRAAIRSWREQLAAAYTYTTEVTGTRRDGDDWIVAIHLEGDFPGGVADLDQRFTVRDGRLTGLHIK
ncbi:nuclear transport factor 2 family protein [Actinoplanes sp. HUAS TT8]|uniref:nuclear transport factor 2 family protein n=1 Tax=Actinoplanes sp. HUAS TT8 TaxID=3447453 RepID=UPI003F5255CF